jgi:hypothetical protein
MKDDEANSNSNRQSYSLKTFLERCRNSMPGEEFVKRIVTSLRKRHNCVYVFIQIGHNECVL